MNVFNNAVSNTDCVESNGKMVRENTLKRVWKEALMFKFEVLCRSQSRGTGENDKNPEVGQFIFGKRLERGDVQNTAHSTVAFGNITG